MSPTAFCGPASAREHGRHGDRPKVINSAVAGTSDAVFEENLADARAYYEQHFRLTTISNPA
ncbi:hypothetical protein [Streptomyces sp. NPDC001292]|uniref:hypothetical protein n=1 Tax=Streptomyces sp. NPDC001292 TaxID=3364558 RepID=UPI0036A3AA04